MVLWKRLNTETSQHGNASKTGFLRRFRNFCKKNGIPQNPVFEGFPLYFEAFPKIFEGFPLFTWQLFLMNFPIFLRDFPIFLRSFRKIFESFPYFLKPDLVEVFPLFFWGISVNWKKFLNFILLRRSSFFWGVSVKFLRHFRKIFEAFPNVKKLNARTAGPKKYIRLEEHLQMFDSPERTGQYRKLLIFSVLKYNLIPPPMTEDLS